MIGGTAHDTAAMLPRQLSQLHCCFDCAEIAREHLGRVAPVTSAGNLICLQELSPDSKKETR